MKTILASAALALTLTGGAHAASVDPVAMLRSFSVIALGDYTLRSDQPSPVFVGGNMTGSHSVNNNNNLPDGTVGDATGTLIVGGTLSGFNSQVKGSVALGQDQGVIQPNPNQQRYELSNGSVINLNGPGTVVDNVDIPVAEVRQAFTSLATSWSGLSDAGNVTLDLSDSNNTRLDIGPAGAEGFNVINLTSGQFSSLFGGNMQVNFTGSPVTTIINVAGTDFDFTRNYNNVAGSNNVILNLYEATSVDIQGTFGVSLFAPNANIQARAGGANVFMVGNDIDQQYEIRTPFTGDLPPPASVPLPAAGWLLLAGVAGLAAAGRRRA